MFNKLFICYLYVTLLKFSYLLQLYFLFVKLSQAPAHSPSHLGKSLFISSVIWYLRFAKGKLPIHPHILKTSFCQTAAKSFQPCFIKLLFSYVKAYIFLAQLSPSLSTNCRISRQNLPSGLLDNSVVSRSVIIMFA